MSPLKKGTLQKNNMKKNEYQNGYITKPIREKEAVKKIAPTCVAMAQHGQSVRFSRAELAFSGNTIPIFLHLSTSASKNTQPHQNHRRVLRTGALRHWLYAFPGGPTGRVPRNCVLTPASIVQNCRQKLHNVPDHKTADMGDKWNLFGRVLVAESFLNDAVNKVARMHK